MNAYTSLLKRLAVIVGIVVIGIVAYHYFYGSGLPNTRLGFKYYEPSYLPPGISIKAKRLLGAYHSWKPAEAELNFRTEDWVYEISEEAVDSSARNDGASQNYNDSSNKPTCSYMSTPFHQRYRLCHWVDYGRIGVYDARWIKGKTYIKADIPTTLTQKIGLNQINKFIDSFTLKSAHGIQFLYSNGA